MDAMKMAELVALANTLGNVLEACRRMGVSRSLFYKWLDRRQAMGAGQGEDEQGKRRRHPHAVTEPVFKRILELAVGNPEWGCDRISHYLGLHQHRVSPTTIQKILTRNGMRTKADRQRLLSASGMAGSGGIDDPTAPAGAPASLESRGTLEAGEGQDPSGRSATVS